MLRYFYSPLISLFFFGALPSHAQLTSICNQMVEGTYVIPRPLAAPTFAGSITYVTQNSLEVWDDLLVKPLGGRMLHKNAVLPIIAKSGHVIFETSGDLMRSQAIAHYPVLDSYVKSGHTPPRTQAGVFVIGDSIGTEGYKPSKEEGERPAINLISDVDGNLEYVDVVSGHHRFLGFFYYLKKYKNFSDAQLRNLTYADLKVMTDLKVYVNGVDSDGKLMQGKLPYHALTTNKLTSQLVTPEKSIYGVTVSRNPEWLGIYKDERIESALERKQIVLRTDKGPRLGELMVSPRTANVDWGTNDTLWTTFERLVSEDQPKVGAYFVANQRELVDLYNNMKAYEQQGLAAIMIVPVNGFNPVLSEVNRARELIASQGISIELNMFTGMKYEAYVSYFGTASLDKRFKYQYSTVSDIVPLNAAPVVPNRASN